MSWARTINTPQGQAGCWGSMKTDLHFSPSLANMLLSCRAGLLIELRARGPFHWKTRLLVSLSKKTVNKPLTWHWKDRSWATCFWLIPRSSFCILNQYENHYGLLCGFTWSYHGNRCPYLYSYRDFKSFTGLQHSAAVTIWSCLIWIGSPTSLWNIMSCHMQD